MAVNGVEIEVGQVWNTRGGGITRITGKDDHCEYLFDSHDESYRVRGVGIGAMSDGDLISLVPAHAPVTLDGPTIPTPRTLFDAMPIEMVAPGYECLANVLQMAYNQAAVGKGVERHAAVGEPFADQVMQVGAAKFGTGALLFQAFKKSEESQRLPHDRAVNELLGAIVYLAGAVIALEKAKVAA